jgi:restriction system protein
MQIPAVRDEVFEQVMSISEEQFEQLCKILIEEVERPQDIELTPFRGDGGIDVRGHYGYELLHPRFGVQSKQFKGNIGSPAMRNFVGALQQHHYQYGVFITTSDYSTGAVELAEQQENRPIELVGRDRLLDVMLDYEVGVIDEGADSYELDPKFWSIFDRTTSDDPLQTDEVPQADSLGVLRYTLQAIDQGYRYKPEITDYMERKTRNDWTGRQADYYPSAGYALGYVHKDTIGEYRGRQIRQWGLTREGQEYVELIEREEEEEAHEHLLEHIRGMNISQRVLDVLEKEGSFMHDRLKELLGQESQITGDTINRRATTMGRWLTELPEVNRRHKDNSYQYEYLAKNLDDF